MRECSAPLEHMRVRCPLRTTFGSSRGLRDSGQPCWAGAQGAPGCKAGKVQHRTVCPPLRPPPPLLCLATRPASSCARLYRGTAPIDPDVAICAGFTTGAKVLPCHGDSGEAGGSRSPTACRAVGVGEPRPHAFSASS